MPTARSAPRVLLAIVLALSAPVTGATGLPTQDTANLVEKIRELNIQISNHLSRLAEYALSRTSDIQNARDALLGEQDATRAQVMRLNKHATDNHNRVVDSRHRASPYACENVALSVSVDEAACAEHEAQEVQLARTARNTMAGSDRNYLGPRLSASPGAAEDGAAGRLAERAYLPARRYQEHPNRQIERAILSRIDEAREQQVQVGAASGGDGDRRPAGQTLALDASLIVGGDPEYLTYSPEQHQGALDFAYLVANPPEMVTDPRVDDPYSEIQQLSAAVAGNLAYRSFLTLLSGRVPTADDGPSSRALDANLQVLLLTRKDVRAKLTQYLADGTLSSPEQVRRTSARLLATQLTYAIERYQTALRMEALLATRLARRLQ